MSAHHPDDLTLLEYSAGSLGLAQALAVSVHLGYCLQCQSQLRKLNALGGVLLSETRPASVGANDDQIPGRDDAQSEDLDQGFDQLMARIESEKPARTETVVSKRYHNPLERYLPASLDELAWQQQTREIAKYDLTNVVDMGSARITLQKIKAGAKVPVHTHRGNELTVVLKGGFSDELGVYHAGDYIARDPSHHHSPTALQNEDCICLTVLDAPMHFTGPLMRWLNPLLAWKA
ncbi:ChrR family anti-sigma-E factor [Marinimicrobium sp. C6131]|uniref:ChrR family anti-sigma-E factor n=1 Tax=Marinimicrobium sp. C6131 TaxID=3022676 RepID=UPI00223C9E74|nr:ChrR family anti-sigma-E factor [Marinimicrobium sp. C6131]UZJ42973.1 ChrR family anti-sigma-E factor [Marinimicrobium sp. C6131]